MEKFYVPNDFTPDMTVYHNQVADNVYTESLLEYNSIDESIRHVQSFVAVRRILIHEIIFITNYLFAVLMNRVRLEPTAKSASTPSV